MIDQLIEAAAFDYFEIENGWKLVIAVVSSWHMGYGDLFDLKYLALGLIYANQSGH